MGVMSPNESNQKGPNGRNTGPRLKLLPAILNDEMLKSIVEDCIVPALINEFLRVNHMFTGGRRQEPDGEQSR